MIIYNVTVQIENKVQADWLKWMTEVHIPAVMKTGYFKEYKLCRMLFDENPEAGTFAIQYLCENMDTLMEYQNTKAKALQAEHSERYKDRYVAIRTLLEVMETSSTKS